MILALFLAFLAILLTGISQTLLKMGARNGAKKQSLLSPYLNKFTTIAYAVLLLVTFISVIVLIDIPLKTYYALASLNFVIVLVLSWGFLKERVSARMVYGILLIVCGIIIFNINL